MLDIIKIKLDTKLYPLESIYAACYVFVDQVYIYLEGIDDEGQVTVQIKAKDDKVELEVLKGEFLNELLHSVHRINIVKNNKKIREYIVERALYSSIDEEEDDDLSFDDPLGIAIPWEEKYGKDEEK